MSISVNIERYWKTATQYSRNQKKCLLKTGWCFWPFSAKKKRKTTQNDLRRRSIAPPLRRYSSLEADEFDEDGDASSGVASGDEEELVSGEGDESGGKDKKCWRWWRMLMLCSLMGVFRGLVGLFAFFIRIEFVYGHTALASIPFSHSALPKTFKSINIQRFWGYSGIDIQ